MALTKSVSERSKDLLGIKDIKRVEYFDSRYYKILYEAKIDGVKKLVEEYLVSVTEILGAYPKDFLARWRGDVGNDRADQIVRDALNLGSIIHYGAEVLAKGGLVVYNPYTNPIYNAKEMEDLIKKSPTKEVCIVRFQKEYLQLCRIWEWFNTVSPTQIETEQTVYSLNHKYAGTCDLLCHIAEGEYMIAGSQPLYLEGGLYVCDYKTGKGVSITYKMQLAAYIKAIEEADSQLNIIGGLIIHPANEQITKGIVGLKTTAINGEEINQYFENFQHVQAVYKVEHPTPSPKDFSLPSILQLQIGKVKLSKKSKKDD